MGLIYCAENVKNGKKYVGLTTRTLQERQIDHQKNVKYGGDTAFYKAIRRYGYDSFKWDILQECEILDDLKIAETYWIDKLKTYAPTGHGYNLTLGGDGVFGLIQSKESIERARQANIGRTHSTIARNRSSKSMLSSERVKRKSVIQYFLSGEVVAVHRSVNEAARSIGASAAATLISRCCRGKTKKAMHFAWKYADDASNTPVIPRPSYAGKRSVEQLHIKDDVVIASFESIAAAGRSLKQRPGCIRDCCIGSLHTAHGFRWRFKKIEKLS